MIASNTYDDNQDQYQNYPAVLRRLDSLKYIPGSFKLRELNRYNASCRVKVKSLVKLIFDIKVENPHDDNEFELGERLWFEVVDKGQKKCKGRLVNTPKYISDLGYGDLVEFQINHVLHIEEGK